MKTSQQIAEQIVEKHHADFQISGKAELASAIAKELENTDAAEALSQAYFVTTGKSPQWSDTFGYAEAVEEIADWVRILKESSKAK